MKYDIYFHNDFDGRASAAVLLNFLRGRGDEVERFIPLNFDVKPRWPHMRFPAHGGSLPVRQAGASGGKNPAIIVDFLYHPKAAFWFDHHETTFIKEEWRKKFRPTKFHDWSPNSSSCTHQVVHSLSKNFGFRVPAHLRDLARWLDVVDGAHYRSARQTIELKEPALQLDAVIDAESKEGGSLSWLIELLSAYPLAHIVKLPRVRRTIQAVRKRRSASLLFHKKHLEIWKKAAYLDLSGKSVDELRFAAYYFYPKLVYNITLKKKAHTFHVTVGVNPWRRKESRFHIGELLKQYGGGGHRTVGGVEIPLSQKPEKFIQEIIDILEK